MPERSAYNNGFYPGSQGRIETVLPDIAEYLYKSILQNIVCVVAVIYNAVCNGEHGIAIPVVEVALGNALIVQAPVNQVPLNIAFATGNQLYNVPQ